MADSALRREMWRVQSLIFALYPAALLVVGAVVFSVVVGLFLPVVTLVYNQIPK
jgi:type II secretory pathway component PulF